MAIDRFDKFAPKDEYDKTRDRKERERRVAYQKVFSTPEGQSVLMDISRLCHVWEIDDVNYEHPTSVLAYKAGRRSVPLEIMRIVKMDPAKFFKEEV